MYLHNSYSHIVVLLNALSIGKWSLVNIIDELDFLANKSNACFRS